MQTDWREEAMARQRQMAEQARAAEEGRRTNVALFERMWLSLGGDVLKLDGTRHDAELAEARGLAMSRWNQLLSLEQQVVREEALLAARPNTRPAQKGDELLPDRTIDERNRQWQDETKHKRGALADLKEQAKRERRELDSFTKGR
jgi:hypothetical protein